jgi:hypothetical protein
MGWREQDWRILSQELFLIDNIPQIEERLKISINVYRQADSEVELFYRSDYKHCGEKNEPINILITPLSSYAFERTGKPLNGRKQFHH